jgi:phage tail protein X
MNKIFFAVLCFTLISCDKKNSEIQKETNEYHNFDNIELNTSGTIRANFNFIFNNENYCMIFFGKDITSINIVKNFEPDKNIPPLLLDFENDADQFIIDELNKSPLVKTKDNEMVGKIDYIKITYGLKTDEDIKIHSVSIMPTKELENYLINLIDIYYLPLYVVQNGDTLSSICHKIYGNTNYEQIVKYNPGMKLANQYLVVRPNEKIRINNPGVLEPRHE